MMIVHEFPASSLCVIQCFILYICSHIVYKLMYAQGRDSYQKGLLSRCTYICLYVHIVYKSMYIDDGVHEIPTLSFYAMYMFIGIYCMAPSSFVIRVYVYRYILYIN